MEITEDVTIANPLPFPSPQLGRASRITLERLENVLVRTPFENSLAAYCPDPYQVGTIMGHIEFCTVLERVPEDDIDEKVMFRLTNRRVVVKVSNNSAMQIPGRRENPIQEISAMQMLGDNPAHVMDIKEALYDEQTVNIVMRYCPGGDLFRLVIFSTHKGCLSEQAAKQWLRQILLGVQYLHGRGICHCDLSPENVVIDGDEAFIIDLGVCLRIPYESGNGTVVPMEEAPRGSRRCWIQGHSRRGKRSYMPPEMYLSGSNFDGHAVDVWTCGTILVFMLTGKRPYEYPGDNRFRKLTQDLPTYFKEENVALSQSCMDLLKGMLAIDPLSRFSLEQVMNHPWWTE